MALRYNAQAVSSTANTLVSGSVIAGNAVDLGDNARQKVRALSALVSVTAATASLTFAARWEGSNDGTTWVPFVNGTQNAASVVLTTGTAAIVTRIVPAPAEVFGWRKARLALVTGGATGAAGDLYSIGYSYRSGPAT